MAGGGRGETKAKGRHASSGGSRERGSGGLMSSTMVLVGARMSRAGAQFKRAKSEGQKEQSSPAPFARMRGAAGRKFTGASARLFGLSRAVHCKGDCLHGGSNVLDSLMLVAAVTEMMGVLNTCLG